MVTQSFTEMMEAWDLPAASVAPTAKMSVHVPFQPICREEMEAETTATAARRTDIDDFITVGGFGGAVFGRECQTQGARREKRKS